jgi:DNA-binding CsgD family transcriptional regulator
LGIEFNRFSRLNERHKETLRLYHMRFAVKEIARKLKRSPHTITEYLREARELLGVSNSIDAARALAEFEGHIAGVPMPERVGSEGEFADPGPATASDIPVPVVRNRFPVDMLSRFALISVIAASTIMVAGGTVSVIQGLTDLVWTYRIDISDPPYRR